MIVASHAANTALPVLETVVPAVAGIDLASTVDRVAGWGGDSALYAHFLARGVAASAVDDAAAARLVGVLAGWRAGVVGLRVEALAAAQRAEPAAAAASLGVTEAGLAGFLAAQSADRFAHPVHSDFVARVGGFRGFGGPWISPPSSPRFVDDGQLEVDCGAEVWRVSLDVFGARVTRVDASSPSIVATVRAKTSDSSYFVTITRAGDA